MSVPTNTRAMFHITNPEAADQILKDMTLKPGPKNVWVDRKPVGYLREGGKVWLCTQGRVKSMRKHLAKLGKDTSVVLLVVVDGNKLWRFNPMPGVYYSLEPLRLRSCEVMPV